MQNGLLVALALSSIVGTGALMGTGAMNPGNGIMGNGMMGGNMDCSNMDHSQMQEECQEMMDDCEEMMQSNPEMQQECQEHMLEHMGDQEAATQDHEGMCTMMG